jgi:ribose-phosphate pyrophosphokinase
MPGNEQLAGEIAKLTGSASARIECRRFPDGESYVRLGAESVHEDVLLVCTLARPDEQFLPMVFAARALRADGAKTVTLVAPYLAYMRQDRAFHPGEAISSQIFADLVSREFDGVVTVDPHLHRYSSLGEIYRIPARVAHSGELIGRWVRENVRLPLVLGPDAESAQWVEEIGRIAGCPSAVFHKERRGDREVQLTPPALRLDQARTPVLVDDIISSGATMREAAKLLIAAGMRRPYCIGVHALFDESIATELSNFAERLLTTDSIPTPYGAFIIAPLIAEQLAVASS